MSKVFLGIDVGSVSTNVIALDHNYELLFNYYARTSGQPIESIKTGLEKFHSQYPDLIVAGVGTTGSGRQLAGVMVGADVVKNEITAHAVATTHFHPEVRTIFEIGGQDSKIILLKDGIVVDFAMNTVCAAGTGSFLDHQAERMKIPIEKFGEMALKSKNEVRIAGRCTVFAESDMIAKQQYGFTKEDIINGLCQALVRNYINNVGRGKKLEPPFAFQGGVAANVGIRAAFEKEIKHKVIIPKYFGVMGAIGAAILAREKIEKSQEKTTFRGFGALQTEFVPKSFTCNGCSNSCEVIRVTAGGKTIAVWGDRCGTWKEKMKQSLSEAI
ncbi:MAG TPA: 2-hydroxyglutaryl-CoA dehydratase [Clostridia bacterium]|nr:2-hydroxyglutaryl-CoA dehydratase [Clostridia bacterium]